MDVLDFMTILIVLAAFFLLMNVKFLKLPSTIGLMIMALCLSLFIIFGEVIFSTLKELATDMMTKYDFSEVLFQVMLSFLLFAGALEMDLGKLGEEKWMILILATVGTLISTFFVGSVMYYVLPLVHLNIPFMYCMLFGALISPTDPIAVLAMIKKSDVSKNLESQIGGESLFNDGVGVVVFLTILSLIVPSEHGHAGPGGVALLFGQEVLGGVALGALFGYLGLKLLILIENEHTEIEVLVTLSMVLGGASIASMLHVSGPLAMVVMGLFVGNQGRSKELSDAAGEYVYKFWHLMDEAMNAILFILIGMQIIVIQWKLDFILAAVIAIAVVLTARFVGVGLPVSLYRISKKVPKYTVRILTWSGLRGGISVALSLSLYQNVKNGTMDFTTVDLITVMTYCVVLFSIVVQGLTVKKLFEKADAAGSSKPNPSAGDNDTPVQA